MHCSPKHQKIFQLFLSIYKNVPISYKPFLSEPCQTLSKRLNEYSKYIVNNNEKGRYIDLN